MTFLQFLLTVHINLVFATRRDRRSCLNCANGCGGWAGDGWNEPREYEWGCTIQENDLPNLVVAYEEVFREIDWEFATVCPHFEIAPPEPDDYYDPGEWIEPEVDDYQIQMMIERGWIDPLTGEATNDYLALSDFAYDAYREKH